MDPTVIEGLEGALKDFHDHIQPEQNFPENLGKRFTTLRNSLLELSFVVQWIKGWDEAPSLSKIQQVETLIDTIKRINVFVAEVPMIQQLSTLQVVHEWATIVAFHQELQNVTAKLNVPDNIIQYTLQNLKTEFAFSIEEYLKHAKHDVQAQSDLLSTIATMLWNIALN